MTSNPTRPDTREALTVSNPTPKAAPRPAEDPDEPVATWAGDDAPGVLRADVAAELAKLHNLRDEAKTISDEEKERLANVRDAVRDLPAGEYTDEAGRKVLTLSRPASFDETTARTNLPAPLLALTTKRVPNPAAIAQAIADGELDAELWERLSTEVVDKALAKDNLPPKAYATCLVAAANPTIKPVDPGKVPAQRRAGGGR